MRVGRLAAHTAKTNNAKNKCSQPTFFFSLLSIRFLKKHRRGTGDGLPSVPFGSEEAEQGSLPPRQKQRKPEKEGQEKRCLFASLKHILCIYIYVVLLPDNYAVVLIPPHPLVLFYEKNRLNLFCSLPHQVCCWFQIQDYCFD